MYLLLIIKKLTPATAGSARIKAKKGDKKERTSEKSEEKRYRDKEGET